MITITNKAKDKISSLIEESNINNAYLRVSVTGGGCSGLSYKLDITDDNNVGDTVIDAGGVSIIVNKQSLMYVIGTELDYSDGLNGKGFTFNNPNASRTCGCGESFSV